MIRDFFIFLSYPKINESPKSLSVFESVLMIVKFILFYYGLALLSSLLFLPLLRLINLLPERGLPTSQLPISFKLIVFVPLYEEIIFRLSLKFFKQALFLSFATLMFLVFYHTLNMVYLISLCAIIGLVPYTKLIPETTFDQMELFWQKYFPFLFYGFALSFGVLHLFNFVNLKFEHYLVFPLIISNQIVMGLLLGYVRVTYKNGFIYSVLIHLFINLPIILISRL